MFLRFLVDEQNGRYIEQQKQVVENIVSYLNLDRKISIAKLTEIVDPNAQSFRIDQINYCKPLCQEIGYQI